MLLLHLSDIHFRKSEFSSAQDPHHYLRSELLHDAEDQCRNLGPPDAIIVSGDISFSGDPEEFSYATDWLASLCQKCGCSLNSVFVVPGNHDVVRKQSDTNMVQMVHRTIKETEPNRYIKEIAKQLNDPQASRLLYESLDNYNQFAFQFLCSLYPPNRTRAKRDLKLNDGSILRLWGLNSTFVSSSHDEMGDLFVDPASFQITREQGVVNLVVTHHHLSWLRQSQELEDHLNNVAPVQIFGHIHTNRIDRNVDYLRLTASAANPDRQEKDFEPGYNFIELEVKGVSESRELITKSHVRVWQTAPNGFQSKIFKKSSFAEHNIPLEDWSLPSHSDSGLNSEQVSLETTPLDEGNAMTTIRDIGLSFYKLSFSKKSEIAGRLELLEEEDMHLPDFERFRLVFIRAVERNKVEELANAVLQAEKDK